MVDHKFIVRFLLFIEKSIKNVVEQNNLENLF